MTQHQVSLSPIPSALWLNPFSGDKRDSFPLHSFDYHQGFDKSQPLNDSIQSQPCNQTFSLPTTLPTVYRFGLFDPENSSQSPCPPGTINPKIFAKTFPIEEEQLSSTNTCLKVDFEELDVPRLSKDFAFSDVEDNEETGFDDEKEEPVYFDKENFSYTIMSSKSAAGKITQDYCKVEEMYCSGPSPTPLAAVDDKTYPSTHFGNYMTPLGRPPNREKSKPRKLPAQSSWELTTESHEGISQADKEDQIKDDLIEKAEISSSDSTVNEDDEDDEWLPEHEVRPSHKIVRKENEGYSTASSSASNNRQLLYKKKPNKRQASYNVVSPSRQKHQRLDREGKTREQCLICRKQHRKCNGQLPCGLCTARGRVEECVFVGTPLRKRAIPRTIYNPGVGEDY
ncbi:uncharacterized protein L203_100443 [Cryptococcus depauperatus CBS 7841]|uniref:Uncharacterized protein n=1 Tax=Cryptococcus depauperatus CBS 7841 TaxID=1295531 RepID=A0A1E3HZK7_9TREE|nr:hypothetical protein L203_05682 [Cryptococcus depauperatus CBS 7841]